MNRAELEAMFPQVDGLSVTHLGFARRVERLALGHLRITMHEVYPEGAYVDVFVRANPAGLCGATMLTDFGNTMAWQLDLGLDLPGGTDGAVVEEIVARFGVVRAGGELRLEVATGDDLEPHIVRLSRACALVARSFDGVSERGPRS